MTASGGDEAASDRAKRLGQTYTPDALAAFVADRLLVGSEYPVGLTTLRILDPAIGDGALVLALLARLGSGRTIHVRGYDIDTRALATAGALITERFPTVTLDLVAGDFLADAGTTTGETDNRVGGPFDIVIANPPYVRTQVLGAATARALATRFGLSGRVDLQHAFLTAIAAAMAPGARAGIIVSNRFLSTRSGRAVRATLRQRLRLVEIWDLGDTRLFDAAVLPAVIIARSPPSATGRSTGDFPPRFSSIYTATDGADAGPPGPHAGTTAGFGAPVAADPVSANPVVMDPVAALDQSGVVTIADGRRFTVRHGRLDLSGSGEDAWRIADAETDAWLDRVARHTWKTFADLGAIKVGVKTCADPVFIRDDWDSLPEAERPELLRPLLTHHDAGRFRATTPERPRAILYPHVVPSDAGLPAAGVRRRQRPPITLGDYPRTAAYLERHRARLEARSYLIAAGRPWFELWVPHDPGAWTAPKLVFRDIALRPCFWVDRTGAVVNGDCYWLTEPATAPSPDASAEDVLWLAAAVGNASFATTFYDHCFPNKLYGGRRRFMSQYVERFPLPDPTTAIARRLIDGARALHAAPPTPLRADEEAELDRLVWRAFGFDDPGQG